MPADTIINRDRRISIQETTWRCSCIARKFMLEDNNRRREGGIRIPESQREWAWKVKKGVNKLEQLVDSIFHNYPIPSAILNEVDSNGINDYEIFDGRHRFETIWRFINNKFVYQGKYYKDLSPEDRERFDSRELPVTIAQNASREQLAEIFIRLNSGAPLTDSDMFWAHRDSPLVKQTRKLVCQNKQLSEVFGGQDMTYRKDLANWVGLVYGLSTQNAGNMTTSYLRVSEAEDDVGMKGLHHDVDEGSVRKGLEALIELYTLVNKEPVVTKAEQKKYKKLGLINAFFLSEWMNETSHQQRGITKKWANLVVRLRTEETREEVLDILKVPGAQNLNSVKIERVLKRVNDYLEERPFEEETDFVEQNDDDSIN